MSSRTVKDLECLKYLLMNVRYFADKREVKKNIYVPKCFLNKLEKETESKIISYSSVLSLLIDLLELKIITEEEKNE